MTKIEKQNVIFGGYEPSTSVEGCNVLSYGIQHVSKLTGITRVQWGLKTIIDEGVNFRGVKHGDLIEVEYSYIQLNDKEYRIISKITKLEKEEA